MSHVYKQAGTLCEVWKSITKSTEKQKKGVNQEKTVQQVFSCYQQLSTLSNKAQRRLPQEVHQT